MEKVYLQTKYKCISIIKKNGKLNGKGLNHNLVN